MSSHPTSELPPAATLLLIGGPADGREYHATHLPTVWRVRDDEGREHVYRPVPDRTRPGRALPLRSRDDQWLFLWSAPSPALPPDLADALASIPRWTNLHGDARRRAVTAVGTAYHDHGLTVGEIAGLTSRSYGGVRQLLHEAHVPIRPARPRRTERTRS